MTTTTTLNDGRRIANLAFSTGSALRGQDAATQVLAALNAGFTHIDTAQVYRNEQTVGKVLKEFFKSRKARRTSISRKVSIAPNSTEKSG